NAVNSSLFYAFYAIGKRLFSVALHVVPLAFTALAVPGQLKQMRASVPCPARISVTESALPVPGWTVGISQSPASFERISLYNGNAGGSEFELARTVRRSNAAESRKPEN